MDEDFQLEDSGDLYVFADMLEERGDPRAEEARRRAVLAEFAEHVARGTFDGLLREAEDVLRLRAAEVRRLEDRRRTEEARTHVVPGARCTVWLREGRRTVACDCTVLSVDGDRVMLEHRYRRRGSARVRTIECNKNQCHAW